MIIGGLQACSFCDYPQKTAAVVFTQGCNFRCPFCHNGSLLDKRERGDLKEIDFFTFLKKRTGLLDGVVVSGGEPTQHQDLPCFIGKIRGLGFPVKLDTNGSNPQMVADLLDRGLLDYIAMDIKAPLTKYSRLCGVEVNCDNIVKTIDIIAQDGIPHHFRTTYMKTLLTDRDIAWIQSYLPENSSYIIQQCNTGR